jgi:hypothetical protein
MYMCAFDLTIIHLCAQDTNYMYQRISEAQEQVHVYV